MIKKIFKEHDTTSFPANLKLFTRARAANGLLQKSKPFQTNEELTGLLLSFFLC